MASACSSSRAKWSATPDRVVCSSAPPSSSAVTSSPVAAFTSGGPPRKMVPVPFTMTVSSDMAGTYAPPAVQLPITSATCGMPRRRQLRLVVEDAPEVLAVGKDLVLERQERAAGVHQVEARQPVLEGDLLGAQVLLDRDRVVRPALHRRVVGDDHALDALDPADAGHDPGPRRVAVVQAVGGVGTQLEEGAAGIDQAVDAVADGQLAALAVAVDRSLVAGRAVARQRIGSRSQVVDEGAHGVGVGARRGRIGIEGGAQNGHPPPIMAAARRRGQARVTSGTILLTCAEFTRTTETTCSKGGSPSCSRYASVSGRNPGDADEVESDLDAGRQGGCCR